MCLIKRVVLAAGIGAVVLTLAWHLDSSQMVLLRHMLHLGQMRRQVSPEDQQNLLRAAEMHDANTVRALLKAGADPNRMDQYGSTPLMLAARGGFEDVVEALLEGGASVNIARPNGSTALAEAIEGEHTGVIPRLQAAGATSDIVTAENGRPLPAGGGEPMETVRAYLKAVADPARMGHHAHEDADAVASARATSALGRASRAPPLALG